MIDFAKKHEIVIVQDAAHVPAHATTASRISFLSMPGAKDVGVEVHSMSKGFDMIGWRHRLGLRQPNDRAGVRRREGQQRLGPVHGDPEGGRRGARRPDDSAPRSATKYQRRLEKLVATLKRCGFKCEMPGGTYFLYTPAPKGLAGGPKFENAEACQPVPDHRAVDLHRAVGRWRTLSCTQT